MLPRSELYDSMMREVNADLLCIADSCAFSVTIKPLILKRSIAGLEWFATSTLQRGEAIKKYCETLAYHDLSSRKYRRELFGDVVLKLDVALFSRYAVQVQVQGRRSNRATPVVLASFCVWAFNDYFRFAK